MGDRVNLSTAKDMIVDAGWWMAGIQPRSDTAKEIARRYRWRLNRKNRRFYYAIANLKSAEANDALDMQIEYALQSNDRGRETVKLLSEHVPIKGAYLDVGTAYAGFLVAFAEAGARPIYGVELHPDLYKVGLA